MSEEKQKPKMTKIVDKNDIVSTKKPLGRKIKEVMFCASTKDVANDLVKDTIVPGIKNLILDIISMSFFGETTSRRRRSSYYDSRDSYYDYSRSYYGRSYYDRDKERERERERREDRYVPTSRKVDYREIVLQNRSKAECIIEDLKDRIEDFGEATIEDLFDALGETTVFTDANYGWTDVRDLNVRRVSNGWLLDVAEAKSLKH